MSTLQHIKKPIAAELALFESRFKESMRSHVPLLNKITYYIVKRKGKQVRPMFVFLTARMLGPIQEATYSGASLIELLHTASLVHDDVVDDSHFRRGFFSVNALWKNKVAVLVGDYLLSRGLLLAVEKEQFDSLRIVSNAVRELSEGELLQMEKARKLDIDEAVYYDIIKQKTASLMAAACGVGASSAGADQAVVQQLTDFGRVAGIAFQIKDDLFDYGYQDIGKPRGIDIKEKKMTLPLIYALQQVDKSTRKAIINKIKRKSEQKSTQREVIDFVLQHGGLDYAESQMKDYHRKAIAMLSPFENNEAKQSLIALVDYIIERKY